MRPARGIPRYAEKTGNGFTIVEVVIVLAIISILAVITIPAIQEFIIRSRVEGFTRTTTSLMRQTRLEAIKRSRPAVLRVDTVTGKGFSFIDQNDNSSWDADEMQIGRLDLPGDLSFAGPPGELAVVGFANDGDDYWVTFDSDGSVPQIGAFRIADPRGNFLEIRVGPAATAKIQVRKWNEDLAVNVDGTHWFSQDEGGAPWIWD